jgi:pimeloyl-ACP methyl ester carboxylesterase
MLLKGHGRTVQALDNIGLKDFINQIEAELKSDLKKYDEIILGGVSFGAQMALHFASKFPVDGVFNVCLPYKLKFPFNIPGLSLLGFFKKYWTKPLPDEEEKIRQNTFYYNQMHANGLKIIKKANNLLDNKNHNLFFSKKSSEIYKNITDFYQNINKEKNKNEDTTAAIIPAYNEAQNIDRVLDVLTQAEFLNENRVSPKSQLITF